MLSRTNEWFCFICVLSISGFSSPFRISYSKKIVRTQQTNSFVVNMFYFYFYYFKAFACHCITFLFSFVTAYLKDLRKKQATPNGVLRNHEAISFFVPLFLCLRVNIIFFFFFFSLTAISIKAPHDYVIQNYSVSKSANWPITNVTNEMKKNEFHGQNDVNEYFPYEIVTNVANKT